MANGGQNIDANQAFQNLGLEEIKIFFCVMFSTHEKI